MKLGFASCRSILVWVLLSLLPAPVLLAQPETYDPMRLYPPDSLNADLRFLQARLEQLHPGLYRYATRAELTGLFDSLYRAISHPMNGQQFLSLLELIPARIRNGHTMILPGAAQMNYYATRGRSLPFLIGSFQGRLYILENYSADAGIMPGAEVLSINGVNAAEIRRQLIARQVRDGFNETYPEWTMDHYFSAYYRFCFGEPDEFLLELQGKAGEVDQKRIRASTRDSVNYYRQLRYARQHPQSEAGLGIAVRRCEDSPARNTRLTGDSPSHRTALLKIRSFDPDILQSTYKQDYRRAIDSGFEWLERMRIGRLILDLRDNQGGDFPPVRYLLAYLVSKPTQFLYGGAQQRTIRPAAHRFTGKLVVLINGGSFSSTAIIAAILQKEKRAVFVGEETGGNPTIISGDPVETLLPHTKIGCYISTVTYRIEERSNDGHGLVPEYPVVPGIDDWLADKDRALEKALSINCPALITPPALQAPDRTFPH
ncbi:MAG TPA: S41 family peptidase [Puia sp.]|jgi:hypothetical protein|nr:S41 family peptidase [Puia sp.]